ncbi:hypothetical protein MY1884_007969 [Beauveria asiatica]
MCARQLVDALIVGGGPAGLSAALAFARQNQTAVVFDSSQYRNSAADYMHLIPGLDHIAPSDFRDAARAQIAERYDTIEIERGVNLVTVKQTDSNMFEVADGSGKTWTGRKMVLATGVEDVLPDIPGYAECWGKVIFHCLYCKGHEQRGASAGVLAVGPLATVNTALHIARQASALSKAVTLYTNGNENLANELVSSFGTAKQMKTDARKIKSFACNSDGHGGVIVEFEDGSKVTENYMTHQPPTKARSGLVDQLGLEKNPNGDIKVSVPFQQSSVRGVFAAGDACSMLKNVPNAIFGGHVAGQMASTQLLAELTGQKPLFPL